MRRVIGARRRRAATLVARVAEPHDALDERLHDRILELVGRELLLLGRVGDEAHLDQHGRHVGADEHAERRLLNRARAHRHALAQRGFDRLGERRGLLDVARLRHLPEDHFDVARPAAEDRQRLALAARDALRLVAVLVEAQVEHLGARQPRPHRRVGVQADEEIRLVVVRDRRALVESHRRSPSRVRITRTPSRAFERGLQPPRDAQRDVLFERAAGSLARPPRCRRARRR